MKILDREIKDNESLLLLIKVVGPRAVYLSAQKEENAIHDTLGECHPHLLDLPEEIMMKVAYYRELQQYIYGNYRWEEQV